MCEKFPANEKELFGVFRDLEKVYDTIDLHECGRCKVCTPLYGVGGKLLKAVQSL